MRLFKLLFVLFLMFILLPQPTSSDVAGGGPVADKGLFLEPVQNGDGYQVNSTDGTKNSTWKHDGTNSVFGVSSGVFSFIGDIEMGSTKYLGWSDVKLYRDGAGILSLRDGTSPQEFRVFNTDDGAGNTEFFQIRWVGDNIALRVKQTGTGTLQKLFLDSAETTFQIGNANKWRINTGGNYHPVIDSQNTIGLDNARPSNIFIDSIDIGAAGASAILVADGENILAMRNGTNPQEQRWYNTDNGSDDEFLSIGAINNANVYTFESEATGSGTIRPFAFMGGNVGIGTTNPTVPLVIASTSTSMQQTRWSNTDTQGAGMTIQRSRGTAVDDDTIVQDDDKLSVLNFRGYDGDNFISAATIGVFVDGVPGSMDMPGRMIFSTTSDGASSVTERMRIDSDGDVEIANAQPTVGTGTGLTVVDAGSVRMQVYKVTLTFAGLSAAALTADHTIATLPAGMRLLNIISDITTPFTGGATSDADIQVGIASGVLDAFVLSHDVDGGTGTFGDTRAEEGTELDGSTAEKHSYIDWGGTTVISVRITTVDANTDALDAGVAVFYIETIQVK